MLATSSIIAQNRGQQVKREILSKTRAVAPANARAVSGKKVDPRRFLLTNHSLDQFAVNSREGKLVVAARATLYSRKGDKNYLWALTVRDEILDRDVVNVKYTTQLFALPAGEGRTVTFDDEFRLPPGGYQVELRLYGFSPGAELKPFVSPKGPPHDMVLSGIKHINH